MDYISDIILISEKIIDHKLFWSVIISEIYGSVSSILNCSRIAEKPIILPEMGP